MNSNRSRFDRRPSRGTPFRLLLGAIVLFGSTAAPAQDEPSEDIKELEVVNVTGSRLIGSILESPSPVDVYDGQDLLDAGFNSLGEFARYLPQNAEPISDARTSNTTLRGSAGFNLRGIGLGATLTLVNGRRVAPLASSGDAFPFVDVNAIPVAAIERIEVLKDGASAIYGSEAVAGVVNIITKRHVESTTIDGGYMTTTEGDGEEWDASVTAGWSGERSHFTGTVSVFRREVIFSRDRAWSASADSSTRGGFNDASITSSPPTVFLFNPFRLNADPACPENMAPNSLLVIEPGIEEYCLFDFQPFTTLQNPSDRISAMGYFEYEISPNTQWFAELFVNQSDTDAVLAPQPYFAFFVPDIHPDNPFDENLLAFGRLADAEARRLSSEVLSWRAMLGMRGPLSTWDWEASVLQSESDQKERAFNVALEEPLQDALLGFGGPSGDQFYNPFGLNPNNSQEVLDSILAQDLRREDKTEEIALDLLVRGEILDVPAGAVGAAFGGQFRESTFRQSADEEILLGREVGASPFVPFNAERSLWSLFAEFLVPVSDSLELQLAVRHDQYDDFGGTTNPKIGIGWRPTENSLLRATWGTSFRPPSFRELFDPLITADEFMGEDPHRCPATGTFSDCVERQVVYTAMGNPDLEPDEGEFSLLGFAWNSGRDHGASASIDFWRVDHRNRIEGSLQDSILEMLDPFKNPYYIRAPQTEEDIALGIPGVITGLVDTYINGDRLETSGIDLAFDYRWALDTVGLISLRLDLTYLNEFKNGIDFQEVKISEDLAGRYGFHHGLPKERANLTFDWIRGAHGLTAIARYSGEFESSRNLVVDDMETDTPFVVDDYMQIDLQYRHDFDVLGGGQLQIGCHNCLDEDPPIYNYSRSHEPFHEGRGAMVYARWSQVID